MTPEKFGELIAKGVIDNGKIIDEAVNKLGALICDELLFNESQKIRDHAEKELGLKWEDDDPGEKHYEFAMTFEGDIQAELRKKLALFIKSY